MMNTTKYPEVTVLDAAAFHVESREKVMVAEASTVLQGKQTHTLAQRLYFDAADVGCAVRNSKTGNVTRWYYDETHRDDDGDDICFEFRPTTETIRAFPNLQGWRMVILND